MDVILKGNSSKFTVNTDTSITTASTMETQDDFEYFEKCTVLGDLKLSVELIASCGDNILFCGKSDNEYVLVACETSSSSISTVCSVTIRKVVKFRAKSVKQLEIIPVPNIILLLKDKIICILHMDTLVELMIVSNDAFLFATRNLVVQLRTRLIVDFITGESASIFYLFSYDIPSSLSVTTVQVPMCTRTSSFSSSEQIPDTLRICVSSKSGSLSFFHWCSEQNKVKENKNVGLTPNSFGTPQAVALSKDRVCIGYENVYVIGSLNTRSIIDQFPLATGFRPSISHIQDSARWSIQINTTTVFLDSNFERMNEGKIRWNDTPSAIVQTGPYVLALINQSIHVCVFDGKRVFMMQQILRISSAREEKCHLWMDSQTKKIYAATSTAVFLLQPIPIDIQIQKCVAMRKYDVASTIIQVELCISDSSGDQSKMGKGNLDLSVIPKIVVFSSNPQVSPTTFSSVINTSLSSLPSTSLWLDYLCVGTMYAFQLFNEGNFEKAFEAFEKFFTDPAEVLCLFQSLSPDRWLTDSHTEFTAFTQRRSHFSVPADFAGVKLKLASQKLQSYCTQLRSVFQKASHQSPSQWLEVQSLVQDRLIFRPVNDLLTMLETALFKLYLIGNNHGLVDCLLRNETHCLLSEVEHELKKYNCLKQLIFFYQKHNQHDKALQLITQINSSPHEDVVLDYLSKLNSDHLRVVFQYIQPMIEAVSRENNNELWKKIFKLLAGPSIDGSSSMDSSIIQFDPIKVFPFLKVLDENLAVRYLRDILPKIKNAATQQTGNTGVNSDDHQSYKTLLEQFIQLTKGKNSETDDIQLKSLQRDIFNGDRDTMEPRQTLPIQTTSIVIDSKTSSLISVCQGDLITQTIDVIVVCSSSQYLFNVICGAGGNSMTASYAAELDKNPNAAVITVKATGHIKSKCVYFLPWKPNSNDSVFRTSIKRFVADAMSKAVLDGYRSIAFPAIGCGQLGCSADVIAQVMVEEVYQLSQKQEISVMFVIQTGKTDVYDAFQKQIKIKQQLTEPTSPLKPIAVPINTGMIKVEKGDITTQKVDVIIVSSSSHFLRNAIMDAAGQEVKTAYSTECENNPNVLLISTPSGQLPSKRIFFVKWEPDKDDNRLRQSLIDLIWNVIQNIMVYKFTSIAFPAIGCGKHACSVDTVVETLVNEMKKQIKTRDLPLMVKFVIQNDQQDIYDKFCKQILATEEDITDSMSLPIPSTWEKSNERKLRFHLSKTSDEYKTLATNFAKAMPETCTEIIRIERIQNARWYIQYLVHSQQFQMRLNSNTERQLYHGCPELAVNSILDDCFNRSFAGVNGTLFGVGVYFSSDAAYSHRFAIANANGERHMFIARVLIGNTIKGDNSMYTRPVGYDSTTDGNHIFVTYHDAQAYAEYLIIYK